MTDQDPAPTGLRDRFAAAIASYDHAVGQATNPAPGGHHYGQADAVLAVRDRELEQLRAEVVELRQRFDNQAQAGSELVMEVHHIEDRIRHVADQIAAGAPWTASHADTAAKVRAALQPPTA